MLFVNSIFQDQSAFASLVTPNCGEPHDHCRLESVPPLLLRKIEKRGYFR